MVLFLFDNVIYVFLLLWLYSHCMFMYDYPDWGFSVPFPQLQGKSQGKTRKDGARPAPFLIFVLFYVFFVRSSMYCLFCVVLCIVCEYICTELLPPGGYPIAVKHIIPYYLLVPMWSEVMLILLVVNYFSLLPNTWEINCNMYFITTSTNTPTTTALLLLSLHNTNNSNYHYYYCYYYYFWSQKFWYVWFQASAAVSMKSSLFWDVTQRILLVTDVSGQPIPSIFRGHAAWPLVHF